MPSSAHTHASTHARRFAHAHKHTGGREGSLAVEVSAGLALDRAGLPTTTTSSLTVPFDLVTQPCTLTLPELNGVFMNEDIMLASFPEDVSSAAIEIRYRCLRFGFFSARVLEAFAGLL